LVPFETVQDAFPPEEFSLFIAIGFGEVNRVRAGIYHSAKTKGYELVSYVSSRTTRWKNTLIGESAFVMDSTIIHPFATIGNNVCLSSNCIIGHDVQIGDHCFLAPNVVLLGRVSIGPYCFIGANVTIRDGVAVAPECVIGAGATILEDTREKSVYMQPETQTSSVTSDRLSPFFGARRRT
jgi:sugar O-acyltransferase (sialic acid O-acetyltransferase NeuD family)